MWNIIKLFKKRKDGFATTFSLSLYQAKKYITIVILQMPFKHVFEHCSFLLEGSQLFHFKYKEGIYFDTD